MSTMQDFFISEFEDAAIVEKALKLGGKERLMKFKPISAAKGDEIRKSCRKVTTVKGVRQVETDQDAFVAKLIVETTVHPDFKDVKLQENWGVMGAVDLLAAMKEKMLDGEYAALAQVVQEVNGYDVNINDLADEVKN
jgi:hypothetical protein